ncbi:hypothetical protein LGM35_06485 [Burkholderia cenocepacia]|uniref:hypothetical protein n=1 Tax=Burkholderia cenocepacia TaxID=95486 RepID=UPI001CF34539|nr:hypothetical protein [Burkholderia cenocepacia]MCA7922128.1 hypothetical protein [Burkholderia cenocepacia]
MNANKIIKASAVGAFIAVSLAAFASKAHVDVPDWCYDGNTLINSNACRGYMTDEQKAEADSVERMQSAAAEAQQAEQQRIASSRAKRMESGSLGSPQWWRMQDELRKRKAENAERYRYLRTRYGQTIDQQAECMAAQRQTREWPSNFCFLNGWYSVDLAFPQYKRK